MAERGAPNAASGAPTTALAERRREIPVERYSDELRQEIADGFRLSRRASWVALTTTVVGCFGLATTAMGVAEGVIVAFLSAIPALLLKSVVRNLLQMFHLVKLKQYGVDKDVIKRLKRLGDYGYRVSLDEIDAALRGDKVRVAINNDAANTLRVFD